jgi:hypothetical protein
MLAHYAGREAAVDIATLPDDLTANPERLAGGLLENSV